MQLAPSELILNSDGSIYHLNLLPQHIANTIITVGDPDRVNSVTSYFDTIEFTIQKREFKTTTGTYQGKRITVLSTGIGTDNIDIVLNELDALVNIDFETRKTKEELTSLDITRIGTSGAIQADIPMNSFLISEKAFGFDNLLHFYDSSHCRNLALEEKISLHLDLGASMSQPYCVQGASNLIKKLSSDKTIMGCTVTNVGFYGPQSRQLRLQPSDIDLKEKLQSFDHNGTRITNLEMETAGIYGLSKLLGHKAVSMNCILANRANGTFSDQPKEAVNDLIKYTLNKLVE